MRILVAIVFLLAACRKPIKHEETPPEDELWIARDAFEHGSRVVEASVQELPQSLSTGGRIAFDDLKVSHVFSPVTGRVTRVLAQLGAKVRKGTPLAAIVSPDVGSAFSDLVKARADLNASERDFHRQEKLRDAGAGSSRDFEVAEDAFRKSRAEEARAQQRLRTLRAGKIDSVTQEYTLVSQIEGRVIARTVNPGMEVQGQFSGGTAVELFTVAASTRSSSMPTSARWTCRSSNWAERSRCGCSRIRTASFAARSNGSAPRSTPPCAPRASAARSPIPTARSSPRCTAPW